MKKTLTILATAAMFAGLFSSCNPCYDCKAPEAAGGDDLMGAMMAAFLGDIEVCREDADSRKEFKDGIKDLEDAGYTCTKK